MEHTTDWKLGYAEQALLEIQKHSSAILEANQANEPANPSQEWIAQDWRNRLIVNAAKLALEKIK